MLSETRGHHRWFCSNMCASFFSLFEKDFSERLKKFHAAVSLRIVNWTKNVLRKVVLRMFSVYSVGLKKKKKNKFAAKTTERLVYARTYMRTRARFSTKPSYIWIKLYLRPWKTFRIFKFFNYWKHNVYDIAICLCIEW